MQNSAFKPNNIRQQPPTSKKRSPFKAFLAFLLLVLLVGATAFILVQGKYNQEIEAANSASSEKIIFIVDPGDTPEEIVDALISLELLQPERKLYFLAYLQLNDLAPKLQAGQFELAKNLSVKELAAALQDAGIPSVWVTVPEGKRYDEIADIVEEQFAGYEVAQFDKALFIDYFDDPTYIAQLGLSPATTLEGYLFPDKYLFSVEATTEQVIESMVANFKTKTGGNYSYEELIVASLIEREAKTEEQRYIISDIIQKRVDEGWFLGIDAANLYYHGDWQYELTFQDLEEDHPYNTRTRLGLTPTPICNPGLSSLQAAQNPENTLYYYYIHDENNVMYPARTLAEHNENIRNYLQ
ncbi:MAG: endolytic transglycosylase MltG [Candidatus Dojkabacteria bacterium]|nr:MAG: endolytic transglycosylase MltG [Candidatus Dojkabacteria bacterium]